MKDTSKSINNKFQNMLMNKSGIQRLIMGAKMEEAAREMALTSIPDDKTENEKKVEIFIRYYKNDFSNKQIKKIINHLKSQ